MSEVSGEMQRAIAAAGVPDTEADRPLPRSEPPATYRPVRTWVLDSTAGLRALRAEIHEVVTGHAGDVLAGGVPEKVVLVASELATNALRYGVPPTVVSLLADGSSYLLDVEDRGVSRQPVLARVRQHGEGGFGLYLARRLALDVGWYTDGGSKHVWATFLADEI